MHFDWIIKVKSSWTEGRLGKGVLCGLDCSTILKGVEFLLLDVHVIRPLPSPRQVQSTIIQPW